MAPLIGELSAKLTERFLQRPDDHTPIGPMWHDFRELQPAFISDSGAAARRQTQTNNDASGVPSARSGTPFQDVPYGVAARR